MGNYHGKKDKAEAVIKVSEGMTTAYVAREYKVTECTIRNWLHSANTLIPWYEATYKKRPSVQGKRKHDPFTIEEKALVIMRFKLGETKPQLVASTGINLTTLTRWINNEKDILDVYFSSLAVSSHNGMVENPTPASYQEIVRSLHSQENSMQLEDCAMSGRGKKTLEERNLRKENEYLKTKVAYLEALLKVNGLNPEDIKKKLDIGQLTLSEQKE